MIVVRTDLPKLCSTRPGDVVQLLAPNGEELDDFYLVAVVPTAGKRAARPFMSQGLYDDERPLFLVNLESGEAISMPHLSSRVRRVGAKLIVAEVTK